MGMTALMLSAAAASFIAGIALVGLTPAAWRLEPWQGVLLGASIYMGVLHRWIAERGASWNWRAAAGLCWRVALFMALVGGQAYAYFEWLPGTDLRAPFVMLSGWIVAETMLSPRPAGRSVTGSWPRA